MTVFYSDYTPVTTISGVEGRALTDLTTTTLADLYAQAADYNAGTTYTKGVLVYSQNAIWVYINNTAGSGNAPPTLPTSSNTYWELVSSTAPNTFVWIAYANSVDGTTFTDFTTGAYDTGGIIRKWIGIAVNKSTLAESTNTSDYAWNKIVGENGASGVVIDLSNDNATVPANSDGSSPNFTGISTILSIFEGGVDTTASWTIAQSVSSGLTGTVPVTTPANRTFTPTGLTVDSGTVTFTATRSGYATQTIVFTISKAKAGAAGSPATVYEIRTSQSVVKRLANSSYSNSTLTASLFSTTGAAAPAAYAGRFIIATSTDGATYTDRYTSAANESSTNYTIVAGANFIRIRGYLAGGVTTLIDEEIIPVADDGAVGNSAIVIDLSNDNASIPSNSDGSSPNFTGVATTLSIFEGTVDVTNSWTISQALSSGLTGTASGTPTNRTFTPTGLTVDSGTVTFTATRAGYANQTAVFTISKAKAGAAGSPATVYEVRTSQSVVKRLANSSYSNSTLTASIFSTTGTGAPTAYSGRFIIATSTDGTTYTDRYTSAANESSTNYTVIAGVNFIRVRAYLAGGTTTLVDEEVIPVADDGAAGANSVVIDLSNDNATVPANSDGSSPNFSGVATTLSIFEGGTDTTSSWTIAQALSSGLTGTASGTPANRTFTPTGLTVDSGTVTFTATRAGYANQTIVFTLSKAKAGAEGTPATVYDLRTSQAVVKRLTGGSYSNGNLVINLFSVTGSGSPTLYAGRFIIATSTDGTTYTDRYTSAANESTYTYAIAVGANFIRIRAYLAGGTTTLVEEEIIPVADDGANATRRASLEMYQWASSAPTLFPSGSSTYTWATGVFDAPATTNGWTIVPGASSPGQILYVVRQSYTDTATSATSTVSWTANTSSPAGAAGLNGNNGANATRTAVLEMYQWASSAPTQFPGGTASTYTWSTGVFTAPGTPNGWTLVPGTPSAGQTLYVVRQIYTDTLTTLTSSVTWSATGSLPSGAAGTNGTNGQRVGVLELYRWSAASPTSYPSGDSVYTWADGTFTAPLTLNGWSLNPPAAVLGQTLWGISVRVSNNLTTATTTVTWNSTTPYAIGYAGTNGVNGDPGVRGSKEFFASGSAWSDATADAAIGAQSLTKVLLDQVTISNGSNFAETRFWNGTAWATISQVINGNLLVNGTIAADKLISGTILANTFNVGDTRFRLNGGAQGPGKGALLVSDSANNTILTVGYIDGTNVGLSLKDAAGNIVMQTSTPAGGGTTSNEFAPAIRNSAITVNGSGVISGIGTANIVVDNNRVSVGGRNLLLGSASGAGWSGFTTRTGSTFTLTASSAVETGYIYSPYFNMWGNQEITLSFESREDASIVGRDVFILPDNHGVIGLLTQTFNKSSTWNKYVMTFTTPTTWGTVESPASVRFRMDHNGSAGGVAATISIRNVKVELGNKATDWSVAPEDLVSVDLTNAPSGIRNNAISVNTTNGQLDGVGGTATTVANSQITVNSSGQITGISSTGNNTVVANNQITISSTTGQISGIGTGNDQSIANNRDNIIRDPQGALSVNNASTVTGRIKIRLPQSWTSTMMRFTVDIYEYEPGFMCTIEIGGYNYDGGLGAPYWTQVSARVLGGSNVEYPVYFGHDGIKNCVWIGGASETWSYPQVRVKDFLGGHSNSNRDLWATGWSISFDTTAITSGNGTNQFSASVTDTLPGADWSKTARRPGNLSELTGTEGIRNNLVNITDGQLKGIGTGENTVVQNTLIQIDASGNFINTGATGSGTSIANTLVAKRFVSRGGVNTIIEGNTIYRQSGNQNYDSFVSGDAVSRACFAEAIITPNSWTMIAFDTVATTGDYLLQDFVVHANPASGINVYRNGTNLAVLSAPTAGQLLRVTYDGVFYQVFVNGVQVGTNYDAPAAQTYFPIFNAYNQNIRYSGLNYGPYTDNAWASVAGAGRPEDNATVGAITGTNLRDQSGNPLRVENIRNNLALIDWWKKGASIPWDGNGGMGNEMVTMPHPSWSTLYAPGGIVDDVMLVRADNSGQGAGGWNNGLIATLNPDKTYRFVVPILQPVDNPSAQAYWGILSQSVCTLNTTTPIDNPYFASWGAQPRGRWFLYVGYIYPRNSTGNTHDSAGVWDTSTGQKVLAGTNYCFRPNGQQPTHRAYQYYAANGAYQFIGRPMIECMDGTQSTLKEYFTEGALLNKTITIDGNGVLQGTGANNVVVNNAFLETQSLITTGTVVIGNTIRKTGTATSWDSQAYSRNGYTNGAFCTFSADQLAMNTMAGLNRSSDITNPDYGGIDYAIYLNSGGDLRIYESSSDIGSFGTYAVGDILSVTYDGSRIRYIKNGSILRAVTVDITDALYFDSSFYVPNTSISKVNFGPMSPNNWSNIGGSGRPADNATVGATIGTNLGGTFTETEVGNRFASSSISSTYIKDLAASKITTGTLSATSSITVGNSGGNAALTLDGSKRQILVKDASGNPRVKIGDLSV